MKKKRKSVRRPLDPFDWIADKNLFRVGKDLPDYAKTSGSISSCETVQGSGLSHDQIIADRGAVYGNPKQSHTNIGLCWTAMLQQHYGITLDHPIPPEIVALMMVQMKAQRSARLFKQDNHDDLQIYGKFAESFQKDA